MSEGHSTEVELHVMVTQIKPVWVEELQAIYEGDSHIAEIMESCLLNKTDQPDYFIVGALMKYKGRLVVDEKGNTRENILQAIHETAIGGHSGIPPAI